MARRVPALLGGARPAARRPGARPAARVAEFARRDVTVAVGGEGADELFGGYPRYRWLARARSGSAGGYRRRSPRALASALRRASASRARRAGSPACSTPRAGLERHLDWVTAPARRTRAPRLYGRALQRRRSLPSGARTTSRSCDGADGSVAMARLMLLDQRHWLPDDVLVKADRAGMRVSLEIRTPYLHRELAEFAASVPARCSRFTRGQAAAAAAARSRRSPSGRAPEDGLPPARRRLAARPAGSSSTGRSTRQPLRGGLDRPARRCGRSTTARCGRRRPEPRPLAAAGCGPLARPAPRRRRADAHARPHPRLPAGARRDPAARPPDRAATRRGSRPASSL